MPQYLSPGVYVEEVPSGTQPIAGVGTSTAGFVGVIKGYAARDVKIGDGDGNQKTFFLPYPKVDQDVATCAIRAAGTSFQVTAIGGDPPGTQVTLAEAPPVGAKVTASYLVDGLPVAGQRIRTGDGRTDLLPLPAAGVKTDAFKIQVDSVRADGGVEHRLVQGGNVHFNPKTKRYELRLWKDPGDGNISATFTFLKHELTEATANRKKDIHLPRFPADDFLRQIKIKVDDGWKRPTQVEVEIAKDSTAKATLDGPGMPKKVEDFFWEGHFKQETEVKAGEVVLPPALADRIAEHFRLRITKIDEHGNSSHPDLEKIKIDSTSASVDFKQSPGAKATVVAEYRVEIADQELQPVQGSKRRYEIGLYPVDTSAFTVKIGDREIAALLVPGPGNEPAAAKFPHLLAAGEEVAASYLLPLLSDPPRAELCTNFGDFKRRFGDFSLADDQNRLAHAVHGFFLNGGTRCFVAAIKSKTTTQVRAALKAFEAIDEIALVAAPGLGPKTDKASQASIIDHCKRLGDRFAILDCEAELPSLALADVARPDNTDVAAFYLPWIEVGDPLRDEPLAVPPSGHLAGVYARVDSERGVHKAPANEVVRGAVGLKKHVTKNQQAGLNPKGVNCIRHLNGNVRVWGARTVGGDDNGEWKYVNVRRLFLYLRESIDEGTQWVVFEPNEPGLWARITRNVNAFLTDVWRAGALFGTTPQQAFYVKCDAETNPEEVRDAGRVVTEIGVAPVRPAEFVVFRVSQWAGPAG